MLHISAFLQNLWRPCFYLFGMEALGKLFVMTTLKNGVWFLGYFWLLTFYLTLFHQSTSHKHQRCFKNEGFSLSFVCLVCELQENKQPPVISESIVFIFPLLFCSLNAFLKRLAVNGSWQQLCFLSQSFIFNSCRHIWHFRAKMVFAANEATLRHLDLSFLQSLLALKVHFGACPTRFEECRKGYCAQQINTSDTLIFINVLLYWSVY